MICSGCKPKWSCGRLEQVGTGGVGVKAQLFHLVLAHGSDHRRGGQIGAFVGVQFDVLLILRLLTRGVGGDSGQRGRKKTTHIKTLSVKALRLCQLPRRGSFFASYGFHSQSSPSRKDFPRPGEDVTAGDKKGNLARKRLRGSLFIPDGHAAGVGVQALALGKIGDAGGYFAQRFPGVVEEAGLLYKVVYAQGA